MGDLIDETVERLTSRGFDPSTAPWSHKVAVMLVTAQGIIDNGGFEYFFESSFNPPTDTNEFPLVFEAVGAAASAQATREALQRLSGAAPTFADLNEVLWQNSAHNYALLTKYIEANARTYV